MDRTLASRLLYAVAALMLIGTMVHGFITAKRLRRTTPSNICELVSTRKPLETDGMGSENWEIEEVPVRIEGLAHSEYNASLISLAQWRHGLAPATKLTFGPHEFALNVQWEFMNKEPGQKLAVEIDGVAQQAKDVTCGTSVGQINLPPSRAQTTLSLRFSKSARPRQDGRSLTVTFHTLRVSAP